MKAICPNCQAAYRVADEKVPDTGAQIKCPKCEHTFVVKRPQETSPVPPAPSTAPPKVRITTGSSSPKSDEDLFGALPPASDSASTDLSHLQSTPAEALSNTPNIDALSGEAFISVAPKSEVESAPRLAKKSSSRGVSAIRAQSGVSNLLDGFRVRTVRGLTYDFPSRQAMLRWLGDREDLEGYQAAEPGGDWVPVEQITGASSGAAAPVVSSPMAPRQAQPKVSADKLKSADNADPSRPLEVERVKPVVPVLPGAPVPDGTASSDPYSAYAGPKAGPLLWIAVFVTFVLVLAAGSVTVTRYGLLDLSSFLPLEKVGVVFPVTKGVSNNKSLDDIKVNTNKVDGEAVFSKALTAGRRALASKRFSRAALEFNRARAVHPGSAKALDGLARAFMGLGDVQRAKEVMKKARAIGGR